MLTQIDHQLLSQPRLADAGFAGQHHQLRGAGFDGGGHAPEERQLAVTLDQHGAYRHDLRRADPGSAIVVRAHNLAGRPGAGPGWSARRAGTRRGTFVPSGPMSPGHTLPA